MIDGLGVTGVEGVFRIACETTMQLLRDNADSLMSVLDAFIHDPLVEWEDEKRKMVSGIQVFIDPLTVFVQDRDRRNAVRSSTDLRHLAKNALRQIERKLRGIYSPSNVKTKTHSGTGDEMAISTSNLVQMLIQEAVDATNLVRTFSLIFAKTLAYRYREKCILDGQHGIEIVTYWDSACANLRTTTSSGHSYSAPSIFLASEQHDRR